MAELDCRRCLVSGRVQGVSFRAATCARGIELGLRGYARNLPDGRVEVYACGDPSAVAELKRWLHEGPRLARVERVDCASAEAEAVSGFSVRY